MWEAAFKWEGREGNFTERERDRESETKRDKLSKRHTHKQNKEDLETQPGFPGGSDGKETPCNARGPVLSLGQEDSLEKGMASHSSVLAWRIPWTEEPGRLQSMGSRRVGRTE